LLCAHCAHSLALGALGALGKPLSARSARRALVLCHEGHCIFEVEVVALRELLEGRLAAPHTRHAHLLAAPPLLREVLALRQDPRRVVETEAVALCERSERWTSPLDSLDRLFRHAGSRSGGLLHLLCGVVQVEGQAEIKDAGTVN
jgi:hypothetical protein